MKKDKLTRLINIGIALVMLLSACSALGATEEPVKLIYRDWEGAMPETILSVFTAKYGIEVEYLYYDSLRKKQFPTCRLGKFTMWSFSKIS